MSACRHTACAQSSCHVRSYLEFRTSTANHHKACGFTCGGSACLSDIIRPAVLSRPVSAVTVTAKRLLLYGLLACLCRCPMHALTLAMCSMLGFPHANAFIGNAHMVASRFQASSAASALLADEARELGINAKLVPCNLSQLRSVHACLVSLVQLQHAIRQMLQKHTDFPIGQEVHLPLCPSAHS